MLPKDNKIRKKKEIESVFQEGRASFGGACGVKVKKNPASLTRFVTVVSLKVAKKAVARNRLKRQLQEILRQELPRLQPGWDVFVLALPAARGSEYRELQQSLTRHLRRLGLYA